MISMSDALPCLCICGCPDQTDSHRYVCKFCAALWHGHDRAHAPPTADVAERLRDTAQWIGSGVL